MEVSIVRENGAEKRREVRGPEVGEVGKIRANSRIVSWRN